MCRSIKTLYNFDPPVTNDDIEAAALQFVRKVSGYRKPSATNQDAFDKAVHEVTHVVAHLFEELTTKAPARTQQ